jgi:cytochrome c biogenesis protein
MRTALFLLLLLAVAAIPGSLVPQVSSDPNGVIQYRRDNPDLAAVLDALQVFTTYTSVWFSAIYLLLFVSLIGCVIPRAKHHFDAVRARPPRTPARLSRLEGFTTRDAAADTATIVESARLLLKREGYRTALYSSIAGPATAPDSVSAERGYARETGNLVFHTALIGVLVAVGIIGAFGYSGQRVVVEGEAFSNTLANYDSFNPGRFFEPAALEPYSVALDRFVPIYEEDNINALGQAVDYTASVITTTQGGAPQASEIKVNEPLNIGQTQVYLLGNGYAPVVTVRDASGTVVFSQPTACLPQDANLTSLCIIKVADGLDEQIGMRGFLYPTTVALESGALTSNFPDLLNPTLTLEVYTGDLGLDNGTATSAYVLNTDSLTQVAGRQSDAKTLALAVGDSIDLPNGLGSVELTSIPRFVSLDIHHDPSQLWVLLFSVLVVGGLLTSLFIPRRRVWVKVVEDADGTRTIEYAGLARGDDPGLENAVTLLAEKHVQSLSTAPVKLNS